MKYTFVIAITMLLFACTKGVTYTNNPSGNYATVTLCSSNPLPYNSPFNGYSKWDIWYNNPFTYITGIVGDSAQKTIRINADTFRIKSYGISNSNITDTFIRYYDTTLSFAAGKIYSVFTTLGRQYNYYPSTSKPNAANVIEEKDTVSPANGYAKVRLLVCVPMLTQGADGMSDNFMRTNFVMYNTTGDTIQYTNRYYLDHQVDTTLLKFTTIPSGSYTQWCNYPGYDRFAFNLESRKIYTIVINQMVRTRTPFDMDSPVLIKHSF